MSNFSEEQLNKLFQLANIDKSENPTDKEINEVLIEIENKLTDTSCCTKKIPDKNNTRILIVDDLELSIHQLNLLLTKSGYSVSIARSSCEAVHELKKQKFDYVFSDLYLPEKENGFEILRYIKDNNLNTKGIIISGTDQKSIINECFINGADEFIAKNSDWHKEILKYIRTSEFEIKDTENNYIIKTEDEDKKIASILIKNLNKKELIKQLELEIRNVTNSGLSNLIIDLQNIKSFALEDADFFVKVYKSCNDNGGELYLCNASSSVYEALSYVFLDNVIKIYNSVEDAIENI